MSNETNVPVLTNQTLMVKSGVKFEHCQPVTIKVMLDCCRVWNVSTKKLLGFGVEGYLVITERNFVGLSTDLFEFGFRSYRNPFIYRTYT